MRIALLALLSLMLACGTRTPLPDADQLGLCSPPFADGITAFALTGDEVVALRPPDVVALDKVTGVRRVIAETRDARGFVVTNGRDVAWTTGGAGVARAPITGGASTVILAGDPYWEAPAATGLAMNSAGVIVFIAGAPRVLGASASLELAAPIAMRGDRVVGFGGSTLVEQRLGEPSARVLLDGLVADSHDRPQRSVRIAPDDSTWIVSGRGDHLTNPEVWQRVHHVHRDGATHVVYRADRLTALSVDADDEAAFVAAVSNPHDQGIPALRIDRWTDDGRRRTPLVRCAGLGGNPEIRVDSSAVWLLLRDRLDAFGKLYRFPRKPI